MSSYEYLLDSSLAGMFLAALREKLEQAGYDLSFAYQLPAGPEIEEYRRGDASLTIDLGEETEGPRRLHIHSQADDECEDVVRLATIGLATQVLVSLGAPLSRLAPDELQARVDEAVQALLQSLT